MTVTRIDTSVENLTMTMTVELAAPPERVWQLWADPRQLERWWGPPECPATVVDHDLTAGGRVTYFMTLPGGGRSSGWWNVRRAEPPQLIEFEDGFTGDDGEPAEGMPVTTALITLQPLGPDSTRMVLESRFESVEAMERLVAMGVREGMQAALGQMDALVTTVVGT